jgi:hypothetical protein
MNCLYRHLIQSDIQDGKIVIFTGFKFLQAITNL